MTKKEAAIVSAYTGFLIGTFSEVQAYADEVLGIITWTHMFGDAQFAARLQKAAKADFIAISSSIGEELS